ncbi:hypothetical protein AVEN_117839-1 [Araneus ventricosus]|uniref:Uncharacterized protein n=1 Tax=Araneus ventricosus TaxID=182803 RepID=A0A4Y2NMA1_ARAVE|nr:hypothetical protein AVEN_117839-1 [Araneus ventricosus]
MKQVVLSINRRRSPICFRRQRCTWVSDIVSMNQTALSAFSFGVHILRQICVTRKTENRTRLHSQLSALASTFCAKSASPGEQKKRTRLHSQLSPLASTF